MTVPQPLTATAFSVLGYLDAKADPDRDPCQFAAYAPSAQDAKGDRDAYRASHPEIRLWVVKNNATGAYIISLT
jgi:hypothetical protein